MKCRDVKLEYVVVTLMVQNTNISHTKRAIQVWSFLLNSCFDVVVLYCFCFIISSVSSSSCISFSHSKLILIYVRYSNENTINFCRNNYILRNKQLTWKYLELISWNLMMYYNFHIMRNKSIIRIHSMSHNPHLFILVYNKVLYYNIPTLEYKHMYYITILSRAKRCCSE